MKTFKIISVLFFSMLLPFLATAQEQPRIPEGIPAAIRTGNAAELGQYLNSTVEILLLQKEDFYRKNVAETILRDFFNEYKPRTFTIRHQGARNDAQYAIGNLTTEKGNFRVYFLLKTVGRNLLIHQIRIELDNGR
jgi:hypothetical protein